MEPKKQQVLPLAYELREVHRRAGQRLLAVIRDVVKAEVKQADELAITIGIAPSHLSAALHASGKNFSVEWLPAILEADREHRILRHIAALSEQAIVPARKLSPEERLDLLERELRASGAAGDAILRRAYGEDG
jgi:hypothetical protein